MTTLYLRKLIARSPLRLGLSRKRELSRTQPTWMIRGFFLILLLLACFALSPRAQAQLSPAPDGGYPNANTAEGTNALFKLTTGAHNTATGSAALFNNTTGGDNTATGFDALFSNTTGSDNTASGARALFHNTVSSNT